MFIHREYVIENSDEDFADPFFVMYDNEWWGFKTLEEAKLFIDEQISKQANSKIFRK